MANSKDAGLVVSRMDRKKAVLASEEISDLLRQAFDKHKEVCRGYQKIEEELRLLKFKSGQDSQVIEKLKRENLELEEELGEAKTKISELSVSVGRLQVEVGVWNRKACLAKQSRTSADPVPARAASPNSASTSFAASSEAVPAPATSRSFTENLPPTVLVEEEDGKGVENSGAKIRRQLFAGNTDSDDLSVEEPGGGGYKRKRTEEDFIPETPPSPPARPLQTNTCKVCERYWRAEDARLPGQLKTYDVPYCKIHGKNRRPPCTPENFWKHARLTPPK